MKIHIITKDQLDKDNNYIGETDLSDFDGHLQSEKSLGYVRFKFLKVKGHIWFKAGSGIEAGGGIEAGEGIKAGWGIKAGRCIKAGGGIKAGLGIEAGFSIHAKFISSKLRIFAGLCMWRLPSEYEQRIVVEKLESGTVAFGKLVIKNTPLETLYREEI